MKLIETTTVKGKKGEPDEVIETFVVPSAEDRLAALVEAENLGIRGKWMRHIILVSAVNEARDEVTSSVKRDKTDKTGVRMDGKSDRAASMRAANKLDVGQLSYRSFERAMVKAKQQVKREEEGSENHKIAIDILNSKGGDAIVVPKGLGWIPAEGGRNMRHAGYQSYAQLAKALPDGPKRDRLPTNQDKPTTVANKETQGWDKYVFFEQDHVWILAEEWQYDFKDAESLLEKYPDGYYEGELQFESKTFQVMGTVPEQPELPRRFTWEQDFDSDDESEFKWTQRPIKTALEITQELELLWWQLKGLQMEIDLAYVTDPEDFELGMPTAAKFAEVDVMLLEDIHNMTRAGSKGHISYLRKPEESSHVPEGQEPMELERGGDWDDALARLLAQQDQQDNPSDGDQS